MKPSQWLIFGMGAVVAGLTIQTAAFGILPDSLPEVLVGFLLSVACIVWALVGLERGNESE
jgi:hypothetical protein